MFAKNELKSGMFGRTYPDGDLFVVAGDKLVFEGGLFDNLKEMDDNLDFVPGINGICELYEATCFQQINDGRAKLIWKREEEPKPEEKPVEPVEPVKPVDGVITITEEQFFDAVTKANDKFMEIGGQTKVEHDEMIDIMMALQNTAFGALIGAVLFNKEIK